MAKGDVLLKFDAQTASFLQDVAKVRQVLEQAADSARKLGEAHKKAGDESSEAFREMGSEAKELVLSLMGIGGATEIISEAWKGNLEEMKEKADALQKSVQSLEDTLARRGDVGSLPGVRARLEQIADGTTSREGVEGIYSTISGAMGDRLNEAQIELAVKQSMKGIQAGMTPDSAGRLGTTFGELASQRGNGGLDKSDDDLLEVAFEMNRTIPAGIGERGWNFVSRSQNKGEALDLILGAARGHEKPRALESLIDQSEKLDDPEELAKLKKHPQEHPRELALAALMQQGQDPLAAMLANPALAPPESRRLIENLRANQGSYVDAATSQRPLASQVEQMGALSRTDAAVGGNFIKQQADLKKEKINVQGEPEALSDEAIWQQVANDYGPGYQEWFRNASAKSLRFQYSAFSVLNKANPYTGFGRSGDPFQAQGGVYDTAKKELESARDQAIADQLKEVHAAIKEQTGMMRNNSGLNNNSAGQK